MMDPIYLAILSRFPTGEERYLLNDYLEHATEPHDGIARFATNAAQFEGVSLAT